MEKQERMQFLQGARDSAPSDFKSIWDHEHDSNIPADHNYALVEVLTKEKGGAIYVRLLASGDGPGIAYAWEHGRGNHPRPDSLRLVDLELTEEAIARGVGERIDFH